MLVENTRNVEMSAGDIHVVPINDLKEHTLNADCECDPAVEVSGAVLIYIHNSWDHREFFEGLETLINPMDN